MCCMYKSINWKNYVLNFFSQLVDLSFRGILLLKNFIISFDFFQRIWWMNIESESEFSLMNL